MRILYIFPHPYDESFGPALAISRQRREGHDVHLLTLTRGEATSQRDRMGLTKEEMGRVRVGEMECVRGVLGLAGLTVLTFPDAQLAHLDPRDLENAVARHIRRVRPHVVVTYAVHGISRFPDHLVTHAVVKRVFCEMRDEEPGLAPRRLALFTLSEQEEADEGPFPLATSPAEDIDVAETVSEEDLQTAREALNCHQSYQDVIETAAPLERTGTTVYFELFQESHVPRLTSIVSGL